MNLAEVLEIVERVARFTGHPPNLECWALERSREDLHALAVLARQRAGLHGGFELSYVAPGGSLEWRYWFRLSDPAMPAPRAAGAVRLRVSAGVLDLLDAYGRPLPMAEARRHAVEEGGVAKVQRRPRGSGP